MISVFNKKCISNTLGISQILMSKLLSEEVKKIVGWKKGQQNFKSDHLILIALDLNPELSESMIKDSFGIAKPIKKT
jgi:hypothetical protein